LSAQAYFQLCGAVLRQIETTQAEAIAQAAEVIADSLASGGALHIFSTGHAPQEPLGRAGGFLAIFPIEIGSVVSHPLPPGHKGRLPERGPAERAERTVEFALDNANIRPGDCLIVISNSGKTPRPVQVAIGARARGLKVVAITSVAFARECRSEHTSGKRLFEVADVVIDNCGVPGDAIVEFEELDTKACPTSGVATMYALWALTAEIIARLLKRGKRPHLYRSVNLPDGASYNERARKQFEETGL
jgi:uncharacterized phosphosugar-binding protein